MDKMNCLKEIECIEKIFSNLINSKLAGFHDENRVITTQIYWHFHLEAQMEKDNSIVFRVFDYGFHHASRTRVMDAERGKYILRFPEPVIIYLYYEGNVPDYYTLTLEKNDGTLMCEYKVPTVKLPEISAEELDDRKMVVLLPFHVLKCRKLIKKGEITDVSELKRIVENDIIGCIVRAEKSA